MAKKEIKEKVVGQGNLDANAEFALDALSGKSRRLCRLLQMIEYPARVVQEFTSGRRLADTIALPLEERDADAVLEGSNAPAHRRLVDAKRLRRLVEAALPRHLKRLKPTLFRWSDD